MKAPSHYINYEQCVIVGQWQYGKIWEVQGRDGKSEPSSIPFNHILMYNELILHCYIGNTRDFDFQSLEIHIFMLTTGSGRET
jgi:hypothetical protein